MQIRTLQNQNKCRSPMYQFTSKIYKCDQTKRKKIENKTWKCRSKCLDLYHKKYSEGFGPQTAIQYTVVVLTEIFTRNLTTSSKFTYIFHFPATYHSLWPVLTKQ